MFSGYVMKRNSSTNAPPMQRTYCSLWGTLLMDFDTEDDSKTSVSPKCVLEVIGVSKWDGQGRSANYPNGLLVVTHTGSTYYMSAPTPDVRDEWIVHIRAGLEYNFANTELIEYKPSKACFDPPEPAKNTQCPKSGVPVVPGSSTSSTCVACGLTFSSDNITEFSAILQIGIEEQVKVCSDCRAAQMCLVWLKSLIYVHTLALHELTEEVLQRVDRYKASFKLRRGASNRLDMAAKLKEQKQVSEKEFEELRRVDHEYRKEGLLEEFDRMQAALETLGNDMQSLLGFLRTPSALSSSSSGTCKSENMITCARIYFLVVGRLVQVADEEPDLLDFYWPQILQIHMLLAKHRSVLSMALTDMLQQGILAIALRYPHLAMKLSWALLAAVGDYNDRKITESQYTACVCLLLQLEVSTYGVASCFTDAKHEFSNSIGNLDPLAMQPPSLTAAAIASVGDVSGTPVRRDGRSVLQRLLHGATHQNQELMIEMYTLLRVRKQIFAVQETEMNNRRKRGYQIAPKLSPPSEDDSSQVAVASAGATDESAGVSDLGSDIPQQCIESEDTSEPVEESAVAVVLEEVVESGEGEFSCASIFTNQCDLSGSKSGGLLWKGLSAQLDFIEQVTDLVDYLRFIDRPLRSEVLKKELLEKYLNCDETLKVWGLDPTGAAAEPRYRINRIYIDECRVFRTKARAPSLIVFEVLIDETEDTSIQSVSHSDSGGVDEGLIQDGSDLGSLSPHESMHARHRTHQHNHASIVGDGYVVSSPLDTSFDPAESNLEELYDHTVSDILEERLTKTKEDMNRERSLSEAEDYSIGRIASSEIEVVVSTPGGTQKPLLDQKSNSLPDSPPSSSSGTGGRRGSASRRLSSSGSVVFSRSATSPEPQFRDEGGNNDDDDEIDLDPLQADGVPDEDAEVTKRVIESANTLLQSGAITQEEYAQLVQSDCKYRDEAKTTDKERARAKLEFYYGEEWATRKQRLLDGVSTQSKPSVKDNSNGNDDSVWKVTEESMRNRSRTRSRSIPNGETITMEEEGIGGNNDESDQQAEAIGHDDEGMIVVGLTPGETPATHDMSFIESGVWPRQDLRSFIVKSNDDLRQEVACIQLIELCQEIFSESGLDDSLWLKPYRIVSTGPSAGFVETLPNTLSIDAIKKTKGFESLPLFFESLYGGSAQRIHVARMNYVSSLAAYSLVCYIFCIKDRHNGNILFDSEGHIIHIDFGFLLGIAPGGSFSVESAPFKLTDEMLDIFGGLESHYFSLFVKAFTTGFLALRSKASVLVSAVDMMSQDSPFPCFQGKDTTAIVDKLRGRLRNDLKVTDAVEHCLDLITQSYSNLGTKQYDTFQWYTNGIVP